MLVVEIQKPSDDDEDENKNDDNSINVESGHWGLPRPRRVLRCLELSSPNHETSVLSIGDTCWAPKRLFRRRIAALDCRPAFQGRHRGDPRESAPRQRRLNLARRWGLRSHPSLCDGLGDWVAKTGLERPVYLQMPLRGNENVQTLDKCEPFRST